MQKPRRLKRPRALQACEICRIRKNRCSEDRPCTYCVEHDLECVYPRDKRLRQQQVQSETPVTEQHTIAGSSPEFARGTLSSSLEFGIHDVDQVARRNEHQYDQIVEASPLVADQATYSTAASTQRRNTTDVLNTNLHTSSLEFYGPASSVAFLRDVETLSNSQNTGPAPGVSERSLVSLLHNTEFQPGAPQSALIASQDTDLRSDRFYFRAARPFLDAYFSNIHHIQPIFEEEIFLTRCEDLWFKKPERQPLSFRALYYATMSLGSLVMTLENPLVFGADRFTWSRKLFNEALAIVTRLGTATDLEMAQCYYMLSKICQHELNPHIAYLYSGKAARTSLAIGINRKPVGIHAADHRTSTAASKTWWAVYCLDIQTSFALGRPDSLGPDEYHTQYLPTDNIAQESADSKVLEIVPHMVSLSRLMRKVALELYAQQQDMGQKIYKAKTLDAELVHWFEQVPPQFREDADDSTVSLKPRRFASYMKKQSVVLRLRYLNLRMVLHSVFMIDAKPADAEEAVMFRERQCRCITAADDTIDLIYSTFLTDDYFQTWWYNATYTLLAVSVLLAVIFRQLGRTRTALENLFAHIDRAIVVLQAMDDCVVAKNAAAIIKRALARAKKVPQPALIAQQFHFGHGFSSGVPGTLQTSEDAEGRIQSANDDSQPQNDDIANVNQDDSINDLAWLDNYQFDDSQQALFWTEWAHEIDSLGT